MEAWLLIGFIPMGGFTTKSLKQKLLRMSNWVEMHLWFDYIVSQS